LLKYNFSSEEEVETLYGMTKSLEGVYSYSINMLGHCVLQPRGYITLWIQLLYNGLVLMQYINLTPQNNRAEL